MSEKKAAEAAKAAEYKCTVTSKDGLVAEFDSFYVIGFSLIEEDGELVNKLHVIGSCTNQQVFMAADTMEKQAKAVFRKELLGIAEEEEVKS